MFAGRLAPGSGGGDAEEATALKRAGYQQRKTEESRSRKERKDLSDKVGDPMEIVLREYSQPDGESIHAFSGWFVGHGTGAVGLANKIPECAIFLSTDGVMRVLVRDQPPKTGKLGAGAEWTRIGVFDQAERAFGWVGDNFAGEEHAAYRAAFGEAWNQAAEALGWPSLYAGD